MPPCRWDRPRCGRVDHGASGDCCDRKPIVSGRCALQERAYVSKVSLRRSVVCPSYKYKSEADGWPSGIQDLASRNLACQPPVAAYAGHIIAVARSSALGPNVIIERRDAHSAYAKLRSVARGEGSHHARAAHWQRRLPYRREPALHTRDGIHHGFGEGTGPPSKSKSSVMCALHATLRNSIPTLPLRRWLNLS
eukprot:scaffold22738_cov31-Tisochrysis_lutea.AAC.3